MRILDKHIVLAEQVVVSAGAFATNLLVARVLGPSQYGVFSTVILVQLFFQSMMQAGLSGMAQVVWVRIETSRKRSYANGLFWSQMAILVLLLFVGVLLYQLVSVWAPAFTPVFFAALSAVLLYLLQDYLRKWFLAVLQPAKALWISAITNLLQLSLLGMLWLIDDFWLSNVLWVIGLTFLPSIALGYWWLKPGLPSIQNIRFALQAYKSESLWMLTSALLQWTAGNFYVLAAGLWLGTVALGALRLAQYIFGLLNVLLQALENYALPRAAILHNHPQALQAFMKNMLKKSAIVIGPVLLMLAVFGKPVMQMAGGNDFEKFGYLLTGLACIYLLNLLAYPLRIALRVVLLNRVYFNGYLITTIFSLSTAWYLLGHLQLHGALLGMFITQSLLLFYWALVLNKKNILSWKSSILY
jgi:O-antigen/teichoic acid export membrane protein